MIHKRILFVGRQLGNKAQQKEALRQRIRCFTQSLKWITKQKD